MCGKISLTLTLVVLTCFLEKTTSKPADADAQAQILKNDADVRLDGYDFSYETSNGIKRTESGLVKPGQKPEEGSLDVNGDFSFTFPDGTPFSVKFVASENGYRPQVVIGQGRSGK